MNYVIMTIMDAARGEIAWQEEENNRLRIEQFYLLHFQREPKLIMFYTGYTDYDTLKAVFLALQQSLWLDEAKCKG